MKNTKLTSEQLSDVIIESMALSISLLERFEIMNENDLFVQKAKQSLKNTIPHIEKYVNKLIEVHSDDEADHFKKGATVIAELSSRIETAVRTKNIMDISTRQDILKQILDKNPFPVMDIVYSEILQAQILNY
jgi:hypothetical protein